MSTGYNPKSSRNNSTAADTNVSSNNNNSEESQALQAEIKEAFYMTAGESRDHIYVSEMKLALNYLGMSPKKEDVQAMFDERASPERRVTLQEFQGLVYPRLAARRTDTEEMIARTFKLYDRDGKGWITQRDLELVVQQIGKGEDTTETELREMFDVLDKDRDGRVTEQDFRELFV